MLLSTLFLQVSKLCHFNIFIEDYRRLSNVDVLDGIIFRYFVIVSSLENATSKYRQWCLYIINFQYWSIFWKFCSFLQHSIFQNMRLWTYVWVYKVFALFHRYEYDILYFFTHFNNEMRRDMNSIWKDPYIQMIFKVSLSIYHKISIA